MGQAEVASEPHLQARKRLQPVAQTGNLSRQNRKAPAQISARLCLLLREEVLEQMESGSASLTGNLPRTARYRSRARATHAISGKERKRCRALASWLCPSRAARRFRERARWTPQKEGEEDRARRKEGKEKLSSRRYCEAWATRLVTGSSCRSSSMRFRSFSNSASWRPVSWRPRGTWMVIGLTNLLLTRIS